MFGGANSEDIKAFFNCSTVEHVGLVGRYGVTENRPDGDLEAMARLRELMKPGGIMLLTIPVGRDAVFAPLCRVYGRERLPLLLEGYIVEKEAFWVKDRENRWVQADRETALDFEASAGSWDPLQNVYALGCFVLRKPEQVTSEDGEVSQCRWSTFSPIASRTMSSTATSRSGTSGGCRGRSSAGWNGTSAGTCA